MTDTRSSIDDFREALLQRKVRIEFGPTINFTQGTTVDTARIFVQQDNGRWKKVDPLLLPQDGGDERASLLADLASIARGPRVPGECTPGVPL